MKFFAKLVRYKDGKLHRSDTQEKEVADELLKEAGIYESLQKEKTNVVLWRNNVNEVFIWSKDKEYLEMYYKGFIEGMNAGHSNTAFFDENNNAETEG